MYKLVIEGSVGIEYTSKRGTGTPSPLQYCELGDSVTTMSCATTITPEKAPREYHRTSLYILGIYNTCTYEQHSRYILGPPFPPPPPPLGPRLGPPPPVPPSLLLPPITATGGRGGSGCGPG